MSHWQWLLEVNQFLELTTAGFPALGRSHNCSLAPQAYNNHYVVINQCFADCLWIVSQNNVSTLLVKDPGVKFDINIYLSLKAGFHIYDLVETLYFHTQAAKQELQGDSIKFCWFKTEGTIFLENDLLLHIFGLW